MSTSGSLNILLLLFAYSRPLFTEVHSVSPHSPGTSPPIISICLPTRSASASNWLSEEERHSVGNLPLDVVRWVRERINRIFASFHQTRFDREFISSHAEGPKEGSPLRWNRWDRQATVHLPRVKSPHPLSPQRPTHYVNPSLKRTFELGCFT